MKSNAMIALSCASMLTGCATYSFAPPKVELAREAKEVGNLNTHCRVESTSKPIEPTIEGAGRLINNYLYAYRCGARQAANGRQYFEVPAMFAAIGGATAAALGASAGAAIGTGAAAAGLNGFKAYYAPKDKLPVLVAAVDALTCVRTASMGVDSYGSSLIDKAAPKDDVKREQAKAESGGAQVAVAVTSQYFALIEAALLQIENIAAQRLSSVGSYSPDALISEINNIAKEKKAADDEKTNPDTSKAAAQQADKIVKAADAAAADKAKKVSATPITVVGEKQPVLVDNSAIATAVGSDRKFAAIVPEAERAKVRSDPSNMMLKPDDAKRKLVAVPLDELQLEAIASREKLEKDRTAVQTTIVSLATIQPQLQSCIVRAKL